MVSSSTTLGTFHSRNAFFHITTRPDPTALLRYLGRLLPGYAALFKHPNDELNYCCYLIPGNPLVTNDDLAYWHEYLIKEDPNVSKALGNKFKIERMRVRGDVTCGSCFPSPLLPICC